MTHPRRVPDYPLSGQMLFRATMCLFVVAFLLGGASRENALHTMIAELAAIPVLAAAAWQCARFTLTRSQLLPAALMVAMCLVPLLQLAPIPLAVWSLLPGRDLSKAVIEAANIPLDAARTSLTPEESLKSLLWLIPPLAVFLATLTSSTRQRVWLVTAALGLCVVSLVLGGIQISDREASLFRLYPTTHVGLPVGLFHVGLPVGLFANRNHQGIAMAAVIPFAAVLAGLIGEATADRRRLKTIIYACLVGLLMTGVLVTRSRAALALSGLALLASWPCWPVSLSSGLGAVPGSGDAAR